MAQKNHVAHTTNLINKQLLLSLKKKTFFPVTQMTLDNALFVSQKYVLCTRVVAE